MKIQELLEAFDQPYDYSWRTVLDRTNGDSKVKEIHAAFTTPQGAPGRVEFLQMTRADGSRTVDINFSIRDSVQRVPAQGAEQRIFSTVLNTIRQYVDQHRPDVITFSGQGAERNRLYQKLLDRELRNLKGYTMDRTAMPNQIDSYMLVRQGVNRPQMVPGRPLPDTQPRSKPQARIPRAGGGGANLGQPGVDDVFQTAFDPKALISRWKK